MKIYLTLLTVALSGTGFAALPALLPEFKSKIELQKQDLKAESNSPQESSAFYTGKPFDKTQKGLSVIFKYRSYDPEAGRWISPDPSGFPDGPNAYKYGINPLNGFDPTGLSWVEAGAMFWNWITGTGPSQQKFGSS